MDYSDKQIFLTVEVGIQSAPRITGVLSDLLRHSATKPVTQKVPASYGDQGGTSLCLALLAGEPLSWFCAVQRHLNPLAPPDPWSSDSLIASKERKTRSQMARTSGSKLCQQDSEYNEHSAS